MIVTILLFLLELVVLAYFVHTGERKRRMNIIVMGLISISMLIALYIAGWVAVGLYSGEYPTFSFGPILWLLAINAGITVLAMIANSISVHHKYHRIGPVS